MNTLAQLTSLDSLLFVSHADMKEVNSSCVTVVIQQPSTGVFLFQKIRSRTLFNGQLSKVTASTRCWRLPKVIASPLTYNLFAASGVGDLAGNSPAVDVK